MKSEERSLSSLDRQAMMILARRLIFILFKYFVIFYVTIICEKEKTFSGKKDERTNI